MEEVVLGGDACLQPLVDDLFLELAVAKCGLAGHNSDPAPEFSELGDPGRDAIKALAKIIGGQCKKSTDACTKLNFLFDCSRIIAEKDKAEAVAAAAIAAEREKAEADVAAANAAEKDKTEAVVAVANAAEREKT